MVLVFLSLLVVIGGRTDSASIIMVTFSTKVYLCIDPADTSTSVLTILAGKPLIIFHVFNIVFYMSADGTYIGDGTSEQLTAISVCSSHGTLTEISPN